MITLFGGLIAITSIPTLRETRLGLVQLAVGLGGFCFGSLVLYGSHLRHRG